MSFTDENLRYAKKFSSCRSRDEFDDLLARLEAAENVISNFATENASPELSNAYIAWRKACGK